jgi:hypothetical protein
MTRLNLSATPSIVTTRTGSKADLSTGCRSSRVDRISERRQPNKFCLRNEYRYHLSPIIPERSFGALFNNWARLFHHTMDIGNPIPTLSVMNLQILAADTQVEVWQRANTSANRAAGIYHDPKPTSTQWTILPKPGMVETSWWAGLELNTCSIEYRHLLIGDLDGHSASWLSHPGTPVQIFGW